ncbi:hypothetical protein B0O99DRAFT_511570 [Bisporella sp. PMI_857]|nr:hypothetical protein B0O99DRAFT_511570 [Bisporella sp. PMI_857]
MSSDLLAEFDSFYRAPQNNSPAPITTSNSSTLPEKYVGSGTTPQWQTSAARPPPVRSTPSAQNDDIWGGMTSFQSTTSSQPVSKPPVDIWDSLITPASKLDDAPNAARSGKIRRPTIDLFSPNNNHFTEPTMVKSAAKHISFPQRPLPKTKSSYGEVLFDADEMSGENGDDDDEFGDFESVIPEPSSQALPTTSSISSLEGMFGTTTLHTATPKRQQDLLPRPISMVGSLPYPQAPKSPSFQERNPFADLSLKTQPASDIKHDNLKSPSPVTAWPTFEPPIPKAASYASPPTAKAEGDDWGDFADLPPKTPKDNLGPDVDSWDWDTVDAKAEATPAQPNLPPPTNIPPPSVLLALFPSIFDLPQTALFKPVASQPFSLKNRIISDPLTIEFLRAYLLIATVAARIIAGRKLRWKRDTMLSQAMKMGPAAGGRGGMKLVGVDKAETTRENREAADVVRTWKDQLGRLRSAIAIANSSIQESSSHLAIPDINEALHIKTQDRALTAPKPCVICGLKREERVHKVDIDVEDSFGEWWTEHWGHRACKNFWLEHQSKLNQR